MPEQLTRVCGGVRSASNTSLQLVPNVFDWVQTDLGIWKAGENLDDVVGEELCGVAGCIGLWRCRVDIQRHTTVDARNKTANKQTNNNNKSVSSFTRYTTCGRCDKSRS